ncbi:MAG: hypothetical protein RLZZ385_1966 [Pseudomonadota bacterium]|jgi:hypothetical protein
MKSIYRLVITIAFAAGLAACDNPQNPSGEVAAQVPAPAAAAVNYQGEERWWKGNTHAHSWWSDGDMPPELVAKWYKDHGYQFLVHSDHNIMQLGEKWYNIDAPARPLEQVHMAYDEYRQVFGPEWIEERTVNGQREVKLKTLTEFSTLFEEAGRFIFIRGEEITDSFQRHPIHMNGVNLVDYVAPQGGSSITNTIQNNIDAVVRQSEEYRQPMLIHLNHPNFHYAQTPEDFFELEHEPGDGFFEMYNGHSGVNNHGDELHVSTERMWDIVLSKRLGEFKRSLIYGVAVDDAHEYTVWGVGEINPGRGWIMVRSKWLTPNMITAAIKRGDFYNSTGVTLSDLDITDTAINLSVEPKAGASYRIEFIGTLKSADLTGREMPAPSHAHEDNMEHLHRVLTTYSDDVGKVLKTVEGTSASYAVTGEEIYVRARVVSTTEHPNPFAAGDVEMAWTQPLVVQ